MFKKRIKLFVFCKKETKRCIKTSCFRRKNNLFEITLQTRIPNNRFFNPVIEFRINSTTTTGFEICILNSNDEKRRTASVVPTNGASAKKVVGYTRPRFAVSKLRRVEQTQTFRYVGRESHQLC